MNSKRRYSELPAGDLSASIAWPREALTDANEGRLLVDGFPLSDRQRLVVFLLGSCVTWRQRHLSLPDRLVAGFADCTARDVLAVADELVQAGYLIPASVDAMDRRQYTVTLPALTAPHRPGVAHHVRPVAAR